MALRTVIRSELQNRYVDVRRTVASAVHGFFKIAKITFVELSAVIGFISEYEDQYQSG